MILPQFTSTGCSDQCYLCECAEGTHGVEALVDGGGSTGTFDDNIGAVAVERADKFGYVFARDIYGVFRAL